MRKPTAFTLIELLVVVAIIALLIAILVPSLARAREQAYQVKCASHLSSIFKGIYYYAEDAHNGNGYLPQLSYAYGYLYSGAGYFGAHWFHQILPYVDVKRSKAGSRQGFYRCPAEENPRYFYIDNQQRPQLIGGAVSADPVGLKAEYDSGKADSGNLLGRGDPKLGPWIEPVTYTGSCDSSRPGPNWNFHGAAGKRTEEVPRKLDDLSNPHCWPLLVDSDPKPLHGCWRFIDVIKGFANLGSPALVRHYGGDNPFNNGVNWVFADGHVAWHSANHAAENMMCCLELPDGSIFDQSELLRIRAHCRDRGN